MTLRIHRPDMSRQVVRQKKRKARRDEDRITTWLRKRMSNLDFGIKTEGPNPHPVHVNRKKTILQAFASGYWGQVKRLRDRDFGSHFMGNRTFYFTGNGRVSDPETLAMIDIDCHKSGTFEGAVAFVEFLRDKHFPHLYWEPSTNGNGIHAYVVVEKQGHTDVFVNKTLDRLQSFLRAVLESHSFDVEMVEVKGHCLVIGWGERKGDVKKMQMGQLGKIPLEATYRTVGMTSTARLTCDQLMRLAIPERTTRGHKGKRPPASISGCFLTEEEVAKTKSTYLMLSRLLLDNHRLPTTTKSVVEAEDLAVFLMFLKFFTENMNPDGSLPWARFEKLWNAVYESGDIDRAFQSNRFAVMRNYLSSLGLIEWADASYKIGQVCADGKRRGGKAAKWKASQLLLDLIGMVETAEKEGKIPEAQAESAEERSQEGERTSFAITNIHTLVQNLSRTPYSQTIRPLEIHESPPLMLNPDEIMSHLPLVETMWTVAV